MGFLHQSGDLDNKRTVSGDTVAFCLRGHDVEATCRNIIDIVVDVLDNVFHVIRRGNGAKSLAIYLDVTCVDSV